MQSSFPVTEKKDAKMWLNKKHGSQLSSSEDSMSNVRREIIRQVLNLDIIDIRTYTGYKRDLLIEVTTMDPGVIYAIKGIADSFGVETSMAMDARSIHKIYCITPSVHAYELT